MKKIIFISGAVLTALTAMPSGASAYGGGGGFPPGYFDNPHANPGLECRWETMELPSGHTVTVPRCHVVKSETKGNDLSQRISGFIERVRKGGR